MECVVDTGRSIHLGRTYVVCHTVCGGILRIRLRSCAQIKPEVSIKYMKYLAAKIGTKYVLTQHAVALSKDSRLLVERRVSKRVCAFGTYAENLKVHPFLKISLNRHHDSREISACKKCASVPYQIRAISETACIEYSASPFSQSDFLSIVQAILQEEKILDKITSLSSVYDRYGQSTVKWLATRFAGCSKIKEKRAGIKPFVLKGQWTREKAQRFFYSYKTAMAIREMSLFVSLVDPSTPRASTIIHNGHPVFYTVKISHIELKSRKEIEKALNGRKKRKQKWHSIFIQSM